MKKITGLGWPGGIALALLAVATPALGQIVAEPPFTAFPTGDELDGRFVSVVSGLSGLTHTPTAVGVAVPADMDFFIFRIFDGDTGEACDAVGDPTCNNESFGHWDEGSTPLCASMYFDPFRSGEADPTQLVAEWCSNAPVPTTGPARPDLGGLPLWEADPHMANNDWWNVTVRTTFEAESPSGEAFYIVVLELGTPDDDKTVSNFKVSANVPLSVFSASFGFEAGIIPLQNGLPVIYPGLTFPLTNPQPDTIITAPTTYNGQYTFYLDVPETQLVTLTLWDGDFDFGTIKTTALPSGVKLTECGDTDDLNTEGIPPFADPNLNDVVPEAAQGSGDPGDDSVFDVFRRDGCVTYTVTDPNGIVYTNVNPSGNQEWERFVITTAPLGTDEADYSPIVAADGETFVSGEFLPTGLWRVDVHGLDMSNSVFWRFEQTVCGEVDGQPVCPEEPVLIGDRVWYDLDADTVGGDAVNDRDGEPGIPGVKVNRVGSLDSVVTDGDGIYHFDVLPGTPGAPASYEVELAPENFGVVPTGAIGDRVWLDVDGDGLDSGEPGIPDVRIRLEDCSGGPGVPGGTIRSTKTNVSGYYWFSGLASGSYCTVVDESTVQDGLAQSGDPDGVLDGMAMTSIIAGDPVNGVDDTLDYGYALADPTAAAIGDRVWVDLNSNGLQEGGEPGLAGVRVDLEDCVGGFVDRTTTDGGGYYFFAGLAPACYVVKVAVTTLPPGYFQVSDPDGFFDHQSSATPGPGHVIVDRDFGYLGPDLTGSGGPDFCLGDVVWLDADADGMYDLGEMPIGGVTVTIRNLAGDAVASLESGSDGAVEVCGLQRDAYRVEVTDRGGVLRDLVGTTQAGIDRRLDVQLPVIVESAPGSGEYFAEDFAGIDFGYVPQGRLANCQFTTPDPFDSISGEIPFDAAGNPDNNLTFDFGCLPQGSIGDIVWLDGNADGVQDPEEPGIAGVTVDLFDCSGAFITSMKTSDGGQDVDGDGFTDPAGYYRFTGLVPGCYRVVVDSTTLPGGVVQTYDLDGVLDDRTELDLEFNEDRDDADFGYVSSGDCDTGRPIAVTFEYTGESCWSPNASENDQGGRPGTTGDYYCYGTLDGNEPVEVVLVKKSDRFGITPAGEEVGLNEWVTISSADGRFLFPATRLEIRQGGRVVQEIGIHTSCSQPLNVGDQFGSLLLRVFSN